MINLVTFSTPYYYNSSKILIESAKKVGDFDLCKNYTGFDLLKEKLFLDNLGVFSEPIGFGFWAWKPLIIYKELSLIKEGDYLFYVDARSKFTGSIKDLIKCFDLSNDIFLFSASPYTNGQYTKKETFDFLCGDNFARNFYQVNAGIIGLKKSKNSIDFCELFLELCLSKKNISNSYYTSNKNFSEFISHRYDQSILSLLSYNWKIVAYQSPDQFGIYNITSNNTIKILDSKIHAKPSFVDKVLEYYLRLKKKYIIKRKNCIY